MNNALKEGFPLFESEASLRAAIESICSKFGNIKSLTILPPIDGQGVPQCACFLKLENQAAEMALRANLQVFSFGSDLGFYADVSKTYKRSMW